MIFEAVERPLKRQQSHLFAVLCDDVIDQLNDLPRIELWIGAPREHGHALIDHGEIDNGLQISSCLVESNCR